MGYRKILVPLDGSKLAEHVLKQVETIADPKAHIHLLSIVGHDRVDVVSATLGTAGQTFAPISDPWLQADFDGPSALIVRQRYLETAGEALTLMGYWVTETVLTGNVVDSIVNEARDGAFDIIAMATHGRTGIGRLVLGSVTQGVLAKAPCSVLVLPPMVLETAEAAGMTLPKHTTV
jgi:nucleotide-binding universal stress UspA family protein